jgi:hypothetical protein
MSLSDSTKAIKFDDGKLRFDLIPAEELEELARVYTIGAKKYADRNWELGLPWGRVFSALMRHAWKWWRGETYDPVDGQHHLASVAWCALALMNYERRKAGTDDRPLEKKYEKITYDFTVRDVPSYPKYYVFADSAMSDFGRKSRISSESDSGSTPN